jgi:hypothetical protein
MGYESKHTVNYFSMGLYECERIDENDNIFRQSVCEPGDDLSCAAKITEEKCCVSMSKFPAGA